MAKNERQKRSARKARQQERAAREAAQEQAAAASDGSAIQKASADKAVKKAEKAAKKPGRVGTYLRGVRGELRRVTWPSKKELKDYSVAVICTLLVFGVAIWLVDTGFIALLIGFTGLGV